MADDTSSVLRWSAGSETVRTLIGLHCYPANLSGSVEVVHPFNPLRGSVQRGSVGDLIATVALLRKVNALG
jgi:hypothetical protein